MALPDGDKTDDYVHSFRQNHNVTDRRQKWFKNYRALHASVC